MKVEKNKVVAVSYELEVEGQIADKSGADKPLEYIHGTGMLLPKFEANLEGKEPGDGFSFTLTPEEGYGAEVVTYTKFLQAAEDLKNDKIDCIVMDALPAEELVKANDTLEVLDGEVFTDTYAIAVQKGNQELLDQINAVLQQLIDDGKIDEYTLNHTSN